MVIQSPVVSQPDLLIWFTMQGQSCASTNGVDWRERSACVLRASVKGGGLDYLILYPHIYVNIFFESFHASNIVFMMVV